SVGGQQVFRGAWPIASGRIIRKGRRRSLLPRLQNRIDELPRGLDAVCAIEQGRVTANAVVEQRRVRVPIGGAERLPVFEIHGYRPDVHLRPRSLRAERKRNAFIGLNIENQRIRLGILLAEYSVRGPLELDGN